MDKELTMIDVFSKIHLCVAPKSKSKNCLHTTTIYDAY